MKRRAFLSLVGVVAPMAALAPSAVDVGNANIRLTHKGEPVTEPLEVLFFWGTPMKATVSPSETIESDGLALYQGDEELYKSSYTLLRSTPGSRLDIEWTIKRS